jgi:hypothetical protein
MPEISHVRLAVPEQAALNRILREGGAQSFPQWLYAEPGADARILWWGVRGIGADAPEADSEEAAATAGLFPRAVDDWTDPPRAVILATVDADRAASDLAPHIGSGWHDAGTDEYLGAACRRLRLGRGDLVLAEPVTEGYVAGCLARWGEGPVAVALDGTASAGHQSARTPLGASGTWLRLGPGVAPAFLFLGAA